MLSDQIIKTKKGGAIKKDQKNGKFMRKYLLQQSLKHFSIPFSL